MFASVIWMIVFPGTTKEERGIHLARFLDLAHTICPIVCLKKNTLAFHGHESIQVTIKQCPSRCIQFD